MCVPLVKRSGNAPTSNGWLAFACLYHLSSSDIIIIIIIIIIQIFISTKRHELADHIFCIPMSNCLIADTEVPENAHKAYRVKFLLNEMIMS